MVKALRVLLRQMQRFIALSLEKLNKTKTKFLKSDKKLSPHVTRRLIAFNITLGDGNC